MLITKALVFDGAVRLKGESKSAPKGAPMVAPWAKILHPTSGWGLSCAPFQGAAYGTAPSGGGESWEGEMLINKAAHRAELRA